MPVIGDRPDLALDRIMLATDFSSGAAKAAGYARGLALRYGSKVQLAHVSHCSGDNDPRPLFDEQQMLAQRDEFGAVGIETSLRQSTDCPVPDALLLMEREFGADIIVAGTQSKSSFDRLLLGSTAEYLIRHAACPVLTVGPSAKEAENGPLVFERIVLATDFSPASAKAGEYALSFAQACGAHLHICHVADASELKEDGTAATGRSAEVCFRAALEQLIPQEAFDWCTPQCTVESGEAAGAILRLAERNNADLLVLGARKASFRLLHLERGVTQDVLARATCPVLTVC